MSINRGRMITTQGAHASLLRIIPFHSILVKSLEDESQPPKIMWISLEARHLNSFKNPFNGTLYVYWFRYCK